MFSRSSQAEGTGAAARVVPTRRFIALALLLTLAGCAARSLSPPPPDPNPMSRDPYRIGVTDVLRISVWRNEELSVDVPVRPDGKISVPLLDDVHAEGLEPTELKEALTRKFAEYVVAPNITVVVLEMNSRFVSVLGQVGDPGRLPLSRNMRILEATRKHLDIPAEKLFVNVDRYGNTSAASVPIALDECVREGRIKPGNIVLLVAFGGGFTWASMVVRW